MLSRNGVFVVVLSVLSLVSDGVSQPVEEGPELVLLGGNIVTLDDRHGTVEALAAKDGRILAVGTTEDIRRLIDTDTRVIDLEGHTAVPGFIEGHGHFTGIGDGLQILDLMHVANWDEVISMVAEAAKAAKPGEWILGRGWHQDKWDRAPEGAIEGFPTHASLSAVSPDNPVGLTHASGHASFVNAKAMRLAGVDAATADPPGGEILHDTSGEPIGLFRERAQNLVRRVQQENRDVELLKEDIRRAIRLADEECLSKGVTSFQDAGSSFFEIDVMKEMVERGEIGIRLWVMIRESNAELENNLARYKMKGVGDGHLTVAAIKRSMDGALGSRGAWLLEPYSDLPRSTGLATATVEEVTETARLAALHGYQLCVHAIGDRANREVLDIFERTIAQNPSMADHRWRIEHAQHLNADDIPRFARLGVVASMQGVHCTSDAPYVEARLGPDRAREGAYVWQKLMQSGALVTNGTDAPVEDVSPLASYYASVTRRTMAGKLFYPDQRMSRREALRSYTVNSAKAAFEEDQKGSLSPGKLADIAILSRDILSVPVEDILTTKVLYTIVGGRVLHEAVE